LLINPSLIFSSRKCQTPTFNIAIVDTVITDTVVTDTVITETVVTDTAITDTIVDATVITDAAMPGAVQATLQFASLCCWDHSLIQSFTDTDIAGI
jgi:hypothetical protein